MTKQIAILLVTLLLLVTGILVVLLLIPLFNHNTLDTQSSNTKNFIDEKSYPLVVGDSFITNNNSTRYKTYDSLEKVYLDDEIGGENRTVECTIDLDCGEDTTSTPFCFLGDVYKKSYENICKQSSCRQNTARILVEGCTLGCTNGACVQVSQCSDTTDNDNDGLIDQNDPGCWDDITKPSTYNPQLNDESRARVACTKNLDCGADGFVGNNFCQSGDVYKQFKKFTCNNPGTGIAACSSTQDARLVLECTTNTSCSDGMCKNSLCSSNNDCTDNNTHTLDICISPGTINAQCTYEPIMCLNDLECDDTNRFTKDICVNPGTAQSICNHQTIACLSPSDCDDHDPHTADSCIYPGNINSICKHDPIVCLKNSDCGADGPGQKFCKLNDSGVYQNEISWNCNNPGTLQSSCIKNETEKKILVCPSALMCVNGDCLPITCNFNADCGINDFFGPTFCQNNDVYQNYKTFMCMNPGTATSSCNSSVKAQLVEDCASGCSNGQCITEVCTNGIDDDGDGLIDGLVELNPNNGQTKKFSDKAPWGVYGNMEEFMRSHGDKSPQDLLGRDTGLLMALVNDNLTATKFCNIMGYRTYNSINTKDTTGRTIWTNGGDSTYNWNGTQWQRTDDLASYRNPDNIQWIADITCKDRLPACSDGIDNDNDGKIDALDMGCANSTDDSEIGHDPECTIV